MKNETDKMRRNLLKATAAATVFGGSGIPLAFGRTEDNHGGGNAVAGSKNQALGDPRNRSDGPEKISGKALYAIEHQLSDLLYGVIIQSTIASGRITGFATEQARQAPGVIAVYSHLNSLKIIKPTPIAKGGAAQSTYTPLQDDRIIHNGQNIGMVVAQTFEQATYAASLVKVEYEETPALVYATDKNAKPKEMEALSINIGNAQQAMADAEVKIRGRYVTPRQYNMPMEPHACIARWQDDNLTVWEPSQWVAGAQAEIAEWMGVERAKVHIISPYVGGGFGSKPVPYSHVALASAAARALQRPVKVSLTRPQTFTGFGGRAATSQDIELGANRDGKITAIIHDSFSETSLDDVYAENCNRVTARMYGVPNVSSRHRVVPINTVTPGWMRAPGESPSAFGLEVAMDEMAYALNIDPLELRLRNWADHDYQLNKPWSLRRLREAYSAGAKAFGWDKRDMTPRSMREGRELIGWGVASGTYPVNHQPAEAKLILNAEGAITLLSAGADIGTGTYTILAQTVAEALQVPSTSISVQLGDTRLPRAGVAGGSQLAGNLTAAVYKTALLMKERLISLASETAGSPLLGVDRGRLIVTQGEVRMTIRPSKSISLAHLLKLANLERVEVTGDTFAQNTAEPERDSLVGSLTSITRPQDVSAHSWSAQFVEVRVDEDFGTIRVRRMVGAFDCGRVFNPKLARSQWIGGMIMGLGQGLLEEGIIDPRSGRVINNNLADYLVPVNADVPEIITIDVGQPDYKATVMGGKAVGEIGIVGVAAAISNAVYHATGKRIRDLPIALDKLL